MYSRKVPLFLFIGLLTFSLSVWAGEQAATEPSVDQVLQKYIEAIGGEEALLKLQTRTIRGQVINDLSSRTPPVFEKIPIEAYSSMPNKHLFIEHKSDGLERKGYNGTTEWEEIHGKVTTTEEMSNLKMAWIQNPQNALKIRDYFPGLSYGGTKELRGHECHMLVPTGLKPLYYTLYFDVESGILRSLGHYWELHDWKTVDGVLIPHKIVAGRKGGSTTFEFTEVTHNQPLDDTQFSMPH